MKVILLKEVKSLGSQGDIVEVSDGHARNFLFPQNLGVQATEAEIQRIKQREAKAKRTADKGMKEAGSIAGKLEGFELLLKEKADGGTLYAAVNAKTIAEALKKAKFKVEPDMIDLTDPIKEIGTYEVTIGLPHGFEAQIRIMVEAK